MAPHSFAISHIRQSFAEKGMSTSNSTVSPSHQAEKSCVVCRKEVGQLQLKRCGRCGIASYCSAPCQHRDWPSHKPVCHQYKELALHKRPSSIHFRGTLFPMGSDKPEVIWVRYDVERDIITVDHPDLDAFASNQGLKTIPPPLQTSDLVFGSFLHNTRLERIQVLFLVKQDVAAMQGEKALNTSCTSFVPHATHPMFGPIVHVTLSEDTARRAKGKENGTGQLNSNGMGKLTDTTRFDYAVIIDHLCDNLKVLHQHTAAEDALLTMTDPRVHLNTTWDDEKKAAVDEWLDSQADLWKESQVVEIVDQLRPLYTGARYNHCAECTAEFLAMVHAMCEANQHLAWPSGQMPPE